MADYLPCRRWITTAALRGRPSRDRTRPNGAVRQHGLAYAFGTLACTPEIRRDDALASRLLLAVIERPLFLYPKAQAEQARTADEVISDISVPHGETNHGPAPDRPRHAVQHYAREPCGP